jgi:hypothetical protein
VSILLPSLNKARAAAVRVKCLSNLKQIHAAFVEYAMRNKDRIPIGYVHGYKQMNYMIWSNHTAAATPNDTSNPFVLFGKLYDTKLLKEPGVLYCPSRTDFGNAFDTQINPWPPGRDPNNPTRSSYACRPEVNWGYPPQASLVTTLDDGFGRKQEFPRLSRMKNMAILADVASDRDDMVVAHRFGANVLYGHGGATWVPLGVFDDNLQKCDPIFGTQYNDFILRKDSRGNAVSGVWYDFDRGQAPPKVAPPTPR